MRLAKRCWRLVATLSWRNDWPELGTAYLGPAAAASFSRARGGDRRGLIRGRFAVDRCGPEVPVSGQALSKVFRGKYVEGVEELLAENQLDLPPQLADQTTSGALVRTLRRKAWVVYSKRPFAGPEKLLDYLGRYTTKTAISNHRLLGLDHQGNLRFSWRDRAHGNRRRITQLPPRSSSSASCSTCCRPVWCASVTSACSPIATSARSSPKRAPPWPCPHLPPSPRSRPSSFACACSASTSSAAPPAGSADFVSWDRLHQRTRPTTLAPDDPEHDPARFNRPSRCARRRCAPAATIDLGISLCHSAPHRNRALPPPCQALARQSKRPYPLRGCARPTLSAFQSPYSCALSTAVQFNRSYPPCCRTTDKILFVRRLVAALAVGGAPVCKPWCLTRRCRSGERPCRSPGVTRCANRVRVPSPTRQPLLRYQQRRTRWQPAHH